jgi:DNA-binding response OmpR family regulator
MTKANIMIVENEGAVALVVSEMLARLGYAVEVVVNNGTDAIRAMKSHDIEMILMDIRLDSELDGIEAARQIHLAADIPVIYTTGYSDEETLERVKQTGPFGYLIKPFDMKDLHVTIQIALEKSAEWNKSSENGVAAGALQVGDLKLDLRRRSATRGRKSIPLTAREYVLLEYLMRRKGDVCSRTQMVRDVWSDYPNTTSNVVDVYIRYLRLKINQGDQDDLIVTVRGHGYKMNAAF